MRLMAWTATIVVIAILYGISQFFVFAGPAFTYGTVFGFFACYVMYKNWRQDYEDEKKPHFTE